MARPREHDDETRRVLLAKAGALLSEKGVTAVTVRRVAGEAGTTTRAVYSLFEAKDGLLRALYLGGFETLRGRTEAVPVTDDPIEDILALARAYRASALDNRHLYGLMFDRLPGWAPAPQDRRASRRTLRPLGEAVARAAAAGLVPADTPAVTLELWALVHGLAGLEIGGDLGPPGAAGEHCERLVAAALRGYRSPAADATSPA